MIVLYIILLAIVQGITEFLPVSSFGWKVDGIWWAEVAAEICAFGLGAAFLLGKRKKYGYM